MDAMTNVVGGCTITCLYKRNAVNCLLYGLSLVSDLAL